VWVDVLLTDRTRKGFPARAQCNPGPGGEIACRGYFVFAIKHPAASGRAELHARLSIPRATTKFETSFHLMKLFIDTADITQIKEAWSWGIIDGVTTNPTHVMKTGRKPDDVYREILEIVNGPVSLETIATEHKAIVAEG